MDDAKGRVMSQSPFRTRVTKPVPFLLTVVDDNGDKFTMSFQLRYSLNGLALFERETGKNAIQNLGLVLDSPNVQDVTALLWVGDKTYCPLDDPLRAAEGLLAIRENVTLADLKEVKNACGRALLSQLPKEVADRIRAVQKGKPLPEDPTAAPAAAEV